MRNLGDRRNLNFRLPEADYVVVREAHLEARRVYRAPAPGNLSLTLSAFTQTAYEVAHARRHLWEDLVPVTSTRTSSGRMESLALTWDLEIARALEDDWDDLALRATIATNRPTAPDAPRTRVLKVDVARMGILNGISDWPTWVRGAPNDPRRSRR